MALLMVPYYAMLFTFEFASNNSFLDKALKAVFNQIFLTSLMTIISIAYSFLLSVRPLAVCLACMCRPEHEENCF